MTDDTHVKHAGQEKTSLVQLVEQRLSELGWNQAKLVKFSGVNKGSISRLLAGSAKIGSENMFKMLSSCNLLEKVS